MSSSHYADLVLPEVLSTTSVARFASFLTCSLLFASKLSPTSKIDCPRTEFGRVLTSWNLPWVTTVVIDRDTYLPVVNGQPFESLQASGGGIATSVNLAYSLTLLAFGLDHADVLVPSLLVIDSPRKVFGNNASDRQRAAEIYSCFRTLSDAYGERLQLIIADNAPRLSPATPSERSSSTTKTPWCPV